MRRLACTVLLVVVGVLLPLLVVMSWARTTVYDSAVFSERAVEPLDSLVVRRELARRLTEQLIRAGNQQAISFRPGFELAIEGVIDTDTFRSIFRNAVRRTHESILSGASGSSGLNLSDSFAVIASSIQVPGGAGPAEQSEASFDNSLTDVTQQLEDLGVWTLDDTIDTLTLVFLLVIIAAAGGSVLLADDRRRAVRRLGVAVVIGSGAVALLLFAARWVVGGLIDDSDLSAAIVEAFQQVTSDLQVTALWVAAYGVIIAAAATPDAGRRFAPGEVWRRTRGWIERRRRTTWGTILLAAIGLVASVVMIQEPTGNLELLVRVLALYLGYLAVSEVLRLVRVATAPRAARSRWPRVVAVGATLVVLAGVVTFAMFRSTGSAADAAEEAGAQECNGQESLCELHLDEVAFPGTHNSMSSSLYPGFLFGEQIGTISNQLNAGVRTLLIDTHYGVPSTATLPGSRTPIILTDRVPGEPALLDSEDPAAAQRAARLAARARRAADARRSIYLCHNHCELGAVEFSSTLEDVKSFLDANPDEVVILVIQDATTPADTAGAIEAAGLADRVATLEQGAPLPTMRELIESGRRLLVFAERETDGAPPWYHAAYDWFQETPYSFSSVEEFNCRPNRGPRDAPLFLLNHWISSSPPDPGNGSKANSREVLDARIQRCIVERGLVPNVIAVDFAERGSVVDTTRSINDARLDETRAQREAAEPGRIEQPLEGTITTVPPESVAQLPDSNQVTVVTELTGGDPGRFCAVLPGAVHTIVEWAEAILVAPPSEAGIADLAYAPLMVRDVGEYVDAAPSELADLARPILERAEAALETLRTLGFDDGMIDDLARQAESLIDAPGSPDGVTVELALQATLERQVPPDRLREAALVFGSSRPDPATLLDLGFIPPEVADASDFDCAPVIASI